MLFKLLFTIGFIASLFTFFKLAKDDIKLISLRISEHQIFDIFFLTSIAALLGARLLYVVTHFWQFEVNIFKLVLFTHFPGLSLTGGVLVALGFLWWYLQKKNFLKARIFDLATLASLPVIVLGFLGNYQFYQALLFILLSVILVRIYYKARPFDKHLNFTGVITLIFVIVLSVSGFVFNFAKGDGVLLKLFLKEDKFLLLTIEQVINIIIFILTTALFIRGLNRKSI